MHLTDEEPFLDAVFARPADDSPRLVYADFLDDSGQADRAELVRVQLALAHLSDDDPRRPHLLDRQAELLDANRDRWTAPLAGLAALVDFRRGVPDSVSVDAATFLSRGQELFRKLRVRRLSLRDAAGALPDLVRSPLLARVCELELCDGGLAATEAALLARCPLLRNLEALDLGFNKLDDAAVEHLARSGVLANLTALALNDNEHIGDPGAARIADSPFLAGLTALDLSGNDLSDPGLAALARPGALGHLTALKVSGNRIGDAGVAALARAPLLARVTARARKLDLRANAIGHAGAAVLAACPALGPCVSVDLSFNYLGDSGFAVLLDSPHLGRLRSLALARNQISDAGVLACRDRLRPLFDRLRALDLSANRLTRLGLGVLRELRGTRPIQLDDGANVQSAGAGDAPVAVSDLVPGVLDGVAEAARMRHRVANPRRPHGGG